MKNIPLIIGCALLLLNIAICMLFEAITIKVAIATCIVIAAATTLSHLSSRIGLRDAFRLSLPWVFYSIGIIQYICAFLINGQMANIGMAVIFILFTFEIVLLLISYTISKNLIEKFHE